MKNPRILFDDGNQIKLGTGIGKFSLNLYNSIKRAGYNITLVEQDNTAAGSRTRQRIQYIKKINSREYQNYISENYDVVLYANYAVPFVKNKKVKYVGVIADMVSFLYPDTLPKVYAFYSRMMIRNTMRRADLVFTISDSVRKEILDKFPNRESKTVFTWLGINDNIFVLDSSEGYENPCLNGISSDPFFLFVSTVEKRKNVGMVIDAFIKLKKTEARAGNYKLVIVGRPGYGFEEFVDTAAKSNYKDDIVFPGFASDNDCNKLYNHAKAFIFPTVYEGFGFAQVECMRCHLPIILSDIPTNREISREYGLFFDLNDTESLVSQMGCIVNDLYDYKKYDAIADNYIEDFNWDSIAKQYMAFIESKL